MSLPDGNSRMSKLLTLLLLYKSGYLVGKYISEAPFTDYGSMVDIFTDLTVWLGIRNMIEQINANAAA